MNGTATNFTGSFFMNPMIRKLTKVDERATTEANTASYRGIASKTLFFLAWSIVGVLVFFILRPILVTGTALEIEHGLQVYPKEALVFLIALIMSAIAPLMAFALKPLVPFLGSLYCFCFSYSIACLSDILPHEFDGIAITAAIITITLVAVMTIVYSSGIIKVTGKFKTVVTTLFFTIIFGGVITALMSFIPGVREFMSFMRENVALSIVGSVIYIVIACLFLLVDFQTIKDTVEGGLPKKYEWIGAFGLAYTVFYLFMQVFNLLSKIQNAGKKV